MVLSSPALATSSEEATNDTSDGEADAIQAVVESYHPALKSGDRKAAVELLSADVLVLESGGVETAEEYMSHHLEADMAFSTAVSSERNVVRAVVEGDVGWVISASSTKGEFRGHAVDAAGAELMVLGKEHGRWKIRAIHWSSRSRKK